MIDFTSSLYLGIKHRVTEFAGIPNLTTGVPSALFEPAQSKQLACKIAHMQGLQDGFTSPSTLHVFYDLYNILSTLDVIIFIDEKSYPVSRYGIEQLYMHKISVYIFRHFDAEHLKELINSKTSMKKKPVIITDGWCPQCGRAAPLTQYSAILKQYHGNIIVDDTQALGILGDRTESIMYGSGGGGILKWLGLKDSNIVCISSLAKSFGVPVAVISASKNFIDMFKNRSGTSIYSSPPSLVHISAGCNALLVNQVKGDERRQKLLRNVLSFRSFMKEIDLNFIGGIFPVQSLVFNNREAAKNSFEYLLRQEIKTVLTESHKGKRISQTAVLRSDHCISDISKLAHAMENAAKSQVFRSSLVMPLSFQD